MQKRKNGKNRNPNLYAYNFSETIYLKSLIKTKGDENTHG
jgi:hypothetical protein